MRRAALVVFVILLGPARADDHPNCRGFIEHSCCCTNSCCWEIAESEVQPLSGDRWRVLSTGQVLARTDFSPDGKFYRCACDFDVSAGKWNRHQGAHTRCIYVPHRGS